MDATEARSFTHNIKCPLCGRNSILVHGGGISTSGRFDHSGGKFCALTKEQWEKWYKVWLNDTRAFVLAAQNMGMNTDEAYGEAEMMAHLYQGVWEGMAFDVATGRVSQVDAEIKAEEIVNAEVEAWRDQLRPYDDLTVLPSFWQSADKTLVRWGMIRGTNQGGNDDQSRDF